MRWRIAGRTRPRIDPSKGVNSCRSARRFIQALADGELEPLEVEALQRHLDACVDCGLEFDTYRAIKSALARLKRPDPSALERLESFLEQLDRRGP